MWTYTLLSQQRAGLSVSQPGCLSKLEGVIKTETQVSRVAGRGLRLTVGAGHVLPVPANSVLVSGWPSPTDRLALAPFCRAAPSSTAYVSSSAISYCKGAKLSQLVVARPAPSPRCGRATGRARLERAEQHRRVLLGGLRRRGRGRVGEQRDEARGEPRSHCPEGGLAALENDGVRVSVGFAWGGLG